MSEEINVTNGTNEAKVDQANGTNEAKTDQAPAISHAEKIKWMHEWAARNNCTLTLEGECGSRRECVGIIRNDSYPDYIWFNDEYDRIDPNGDVWTPPAAYHKHDCVAVLGRGEEAETALYIWLQWFDENGFEVETVERQVDKPLDHIERLMGRDKHNRMIRRNY